MCGQALAYRSPQLTIWTHREGAIPLDLMEEDARNLSLPAAKVTAKFFRGARAARRPRATDC